MDKLMTPEQIKALVRDGGDINWLAATALYAEIDSLEDRIADLTSNDE